MLEGLQKSNSGTTLAEFFRVLESEITEDRRELENLLSSLQGSQSTARKLSGWLAEKLTAWKLRLDDSADGSFRLFESLEALSLGIEGKTGLWGALSVLQAQVPEVARLDLARLKERSVEQRKRVERLRHEQANVAFVAIDP